MKRMIEGEEFGRIILVSGDGDYKKLVDFLIKRNKFEKYYFLMKNLPHLYIKSWVQNTMII